MTKLGLCVTLCGVLSFALNAKPNAQTMEEINRLIQSVEQSSCIFIRNGTEHDAQSAAEHLRLKLRNGAKYIETSEQFISRLASKSSWTNKAYSIRCGEVSQSSEAWLMASLASLRTSQTTGQ